jgi:hypothetical protein
VDCQELWVELPRRERVHLRERVRERPLYERRNAAGFANAIRDFFRKATREPDTIIYATLDITGLHDPPLQVEAVEDDPLKWVATNLLQLLADYPNEWIMVRNNRVVGHHPKDPTKLVQQAAKHGIVDPFITKMEKSSKAWGTAFSTHGR